MNANERGPLLSYPIWLSLSMETRQKIATMFGFSQRTGTEVVGGVVVRDGFAHEDLWQITVEKMQEVLGSKETDFYQLFDAVVEKIEKPAPVQEEQETLTNGDITPEKQESVTEAPRAAVKTRGKKKKDVS